MSVAASEKMQDFVAAATELAEAMFSSDCDAPHLVLVALDDPEVSVVLDEIDCDIAAVREAVQGFIDSVPRNPYRVRNPDVSYEVREIVDVALREVSRLRRPEFLSSVIVAIASEYPTDLGGALQELGATSERIFDVLEQFGGLPVVATATPPPSPDLESEIDRAARNAPTFVVKAGRLAYRHATPRQLLFRHKQLLDPYLRRLEDVARNRTNSHQLIDRAVREYAISYRNINKPLGAMKVFIDGAAIQSAADYHNETDSEDFPKLDPEFEVAVRSFTLAHTALMSIFPDVSNLAHELDGYRQTTSSLRSLRHKVMSPVLSKLSTARSILDDDARLLSAALGPDFDDKHAQLAALRMISSANHSWLRGILGAMGRVILRKSKGPLNAPSGSEFVNATVSSENSAAEASLQLADRLSEFIERHSDELNNLGVSLPTAFGWIKTLVEFNREVPPT